MWVFFSSLLPQPCLGKMLNVLTSYSSTVERVSGFQSCKKFAGQVRQAMRKLHEDMSKCVNSRTGTIHQKVSSVDWNKCVKKWNKLGEKDLFSSVSLRSAVFFFFLALYFGSRLRIKLFLCFFFWFYRIPVMTRLSPLLAGRRSRCASTPWTDSSPSPSSLLGSLLLVIRLITQSARLRDACNVAV